MRSRTPHIMMHQLTKALAKGLTGLGILLAQPALLPTSVWAQGRVPSGSDVFFLRQSDFQIPLEILPEKRAQIQELRLFVSTNEGRSWKMALTGKPSQTSFLYHAESDGEYWFNVAFVDQRGQMQPEDLRSKPPQLKIFLDTHPPVVDLQALPRSPTHAGVTWKVSDEKIDYAAMKLEMQRAGEGGWQELAIDKMREGSQEWPANGSDDISVRAVVRDKAGNTTVARVELPRFDKTPASANTSAAGRYEERGQPGLVTTASRNDSVTNQPRPFTASAQDWQVPPPPRMSGGNGNSDSFARPADSRAIDEGVDDRQVAMNTERPAVGQRAEAADSGYDPLPSTRPTRATRERPAAPEVEVFDRSKPDLPADPRFTKPGRPPESGRGVQTVTANKIPIATARDLGGPAPPAGGALEAEPKKIPLVNEPHFAVEYQLKGVGPAGVGKVELFYTKDNGQTWELFGEDSDRRPPFEVDLPGEGRYGLRVVVSSPAGFGQKPPQRGDAPHMLVEVDTTAPEAKLFPPIPDPNAPGDALLMSWSTKDLHPARSPVSLYFAEFPEGPWYAIKTDLPSEGQFSWRVKPGTPYQVYLRLAAKDLADNTTVADTPQPILVDLSRPEAEVIGIAILPDKAANR